MIVADYLITLSHTQAELDKWLKFTRRVLAEIELMNSPPKKVKAALAQIEVQELERMYTEDTNG